MSAEQKKQRGDLPEEVGGAPRGETDPPPPLKSICGTSQARFLGQYNPVWDCPYQRPTPNQGLVLDPELTRLLEEERKSRAMNVHHKRKDWLKHYSDECVKFQSIVKSGKR